jgi:hypothetical protein
MRVAFSMDIDKTDLLFHLRKEQEDPLDSTPLGPIGRALRASNVRYRELLLLKRHLESQFKSQQVEVVTFTTDDALIPLAWATRSLLTQPPPPPRPRATGRCAGPKQEGERHLRCEHMEIRLDSPTRSGSSCGTGGTGPGPRATRCEGTCARDRNNERVPSVETCLRDHAASRSRMLLI